MKLGVIIRSTGERTHKLCCESVRQFVHDRNIHVINNTCPFSKAVEEMFEIAISTDWDWYIGLDADVILMRDWMPRVWRVFLEEETKRAFTENKTKVNDLFKIDFMLQDRFIGLTPGVHFYNNRFSKKALEVLKLTKDSNKPEGNIRHKIGVPFIQPNMTIGYHGYEQYYSDIFNRFVVRASRNPEYVDKHNIFKRDLSTEVNPVELVVAYDGWKYGIEDRRRALKYMDATNKQDISTYGFKELQPLDITLEKFYESVS
jgi:hypothetical protein